MFLKKLDTLNLITTQGLCQIELLIGDITQMTERDRVDFMIVSTHQSYYYVMNEPLMQALRKDLDIKVDQHSRDPDVDLKKNYLCSLSKTFPREMPFSRLICYERQADSRNLATSIRNIFRGLIPILDYRDKTAITNLLGTWYQNFDRAQVLKMTVNAACHWMKVGLQLRCLKIVLCRKDYKGNFIDNEGCLEEFEKLKEKWTLDKSLRFQKRYDVYISYHRYDQKKADALALSLTQANENLKIFCEPVAKSANAWPERAMLKIYGCKRFFPILTSYYMKSKDCLDEFMTAICYQNSLEDLEVVPLNMETFYTLPPMIRNYTTVDCRLSRGENLTDKFGTVCKKMSHDFTISEEKIEEKNEAFDIYISYGENHWRDAENVYRILKRDHPHLNVFYDKMGIKYERTWTHSIYKALDEVQCCFILVSADYFTTKLCIEEFNIVVARRLLEKSEKQMAIIPVCIADFLFAPTWFGKTRIIDARRTLFQETIQNLSVRIGHAFENNTIQQDFDWFLQPEIDQDWCFKDELRRYRMDLFCQHYLEHHGSIISRMLPDTFTKPLSIVICYSTYDRRIAGLLVDLIMKEIPWVHLILLHKPDKDTYYHLDTADHIVMFVCEDYLSSMTGQEILSICMERQRRSKRRILHFACTCLIPDTFSFLHILPYSINFTDQIWGKMRKIYPGKEDIKVRLRGVRGKFTCEKFETMALQKLLQDIIVSEQFGCTYPDELKNVLPFLKIFDKFSMLIFIDDVVIPCPSEYLNSTCHSESLCEESIDEGKSLFAELIDYKNQET